MSDNNLKALIGFLVVLGILFIALFTKGCTNEHAARKTLEQSGYSDIQVGGYDLFGCGKENTCTKFRAKGPTGKLAKGAVGCGWFAKHCTVRIDAN